MDKFYKIVQDGPFYFALFEVKSKLVIECLMAIKTLLNWITFIWVCKGRKEKWIAHPFQPKTILFCGISILTSGKRLIQLMRPEARNIEMLALKTVLLYFAAKQTSELLFEKRKATSYLQFSYGSVCVLGCHLLQKMKIVRDDACIDCALWDTILTTISSV